MIKVNNQVVRFIKFPGGEVQVNISEILPSLLKNSPLLVEAHLKNSDDFYLLAQVKSILDNISKDVTLILPYIPYGRSDRVMTFGEASGLKVFSKLLNSLNFSKVITSDPHSDVTEALIENLEINTQFHCFESLYTSLLYSSLSIDHLQWDYLICPDAGALKKINIISSYLKLPVIECSKKRDLVSNKITGTTINSSVENIERLEGKNVLIVDDLSDYGTTFRNIAKILKEDFKVNSVDLYVTHAILPLNLRQEPPSRYSFILEYIDKIYCYYLWQSQEDPEIPQNIIYRNLY